MASASRRKRARAGEVEQLGPDQLEGHLAAQRGLAGPVHDPHAPAAQALEELKVPQPLRHGSVPHAEVDSHRAQHLEARAQFVLELGGLPAGLLEGIAPIGRWMVQAMGQDLLGAIRFGGGHRVHGSACSPWRVRGPALPPAPGAPRARGPG